LAGQAKPADAQRHNRPGKEPIADDGLMADGHTAALVPR
jgi:hypothetical protein